MQLRAAWAAWVARSGSSRRFQWLQMAPDGLGGNIYIYMFFLEYHFCSLSREWPQIFENLDPDGSKWLQMAPDGSTWLQMAPDSSTRIQINLNGSGWLQVAKEAICSSRNCTFSFIQREGVDSRKSNEGLQIAPYSFT